MTSNSGRRTACEDANGRLPAAGSPVTAGVTPPPGPSPPAIAGHRGRAQGARRGAPLLAASIFLVILNVFLFFLQIFSREE
jgi:hypothetical protein